MSVKSQKQNLNLQINDFIQLLQTNQSNSLMRRKQSHDSDKLSVIYSASEPESSVTGKSDTHNSTHKYLSVQQIGEIDTIFKEVKTLGLTSQQQKYFNRLQILTTEMKKNLVIYESRLKIIQQQFEEQKRGTDEILRALEKMDESEKQLWNNYTDLSNRYLKLEDEKKVMKKDNQNLKIQLNEAQKDIEFMKKLVLLANQNYGNIEKKCKHLERNSKLLERFQQQRSSPILMSRSTIVNKKSQHSPSISEKHNASVNKESIEDSYRKMVLKTLKSKPIR